MMDDPRPYMRIADAIRTQITDGTLRPGDQVPTVGTLAEEHRVSRQTAGKAMHLLLDEGLIFRFLGTRYHVANKQGAADRTWRCSCGMEFGNIPGLEDHLFVFPEEDEHYELAEGCLRPERVQS